MNQLNDNSQHNEIAIAKILNAPGLNKIFSLSQNSVPTKVNPILKNEALFDLYECSLFIENYSTNGTLNLRVFKMLDFLVKCLSDINEYKKMKMRKLKRLFNLAWMNMLIC